ncbi:hypothetical protein OQJ62_15680 [Microbulbifer thermotolerans]|uniref:hypothetical protein n=1 Tax=Microbulbifer thermotolerans TaxID=252514 RepID=UPI00224971DB|nr:hypothetical protein [Microbulbifer thermotolerans]MCX2796366.1 hypothetical protein [Microbulbifer thermotolerans]
MTLQRIHNDDRYFFYAIPIDEVMEKLGENCTFHMNSAPIAYSESWKEPLFLDFGPAMEGEKCEFEEIPDLCVNIGRLFLSERAYSQLHEDLRQDGEFLPVVYEGGTGYIFNPLTIAEDHDALDQSVTTADEFGELQNLGILEDKLPESTMVFKCKADFYHGVFCTDAFKRAVEDAGLTGIYFHPDLSNIFGATSPAAH